MNGVSCHTYSYIHTQFTQHAVNVSHFRRFSLLAVKKKRKKKVWHILNLIAFCFNGPFVQNYFSAFSSRLWWFMGRERITKPRETERSFCIFVLLNFSFNSKYRKCILFYCLFAACFPTKCITTGNRILECVLTTSSSSIYRFRAKTTPSNDLK